jgi:hypothetical protein
LYSPIDEVTTAIHASHVAQRASALALLAFELRHFRRRTIESHCSNCGAKHPGRERAIEHALDIQ